MKVTILCVGKIKEKFYRDALDEYIKRLGKYCKFEIVEVADEKTPDHAGEALENQIKGKEAERILAKLKPDTYICTLEIQGQQMSSPQFAECLNQLGIRGKSSVTFIIGGSLGLHQSVLERSDQSISFSKMTFPHQLMRVILCEQIYRAYRIINNEPYHK